ncbi:MAG: DNA-binding protein [Acidimicrobiales bacterium]|nr:MAG: DNA-binding protein [Acidimicrobiales bacterium]
MSPLTADEYAALPEVLTPEDVAAMLGTSAVVVRRWAAQNRIPGVQIGRMWRFSKRRIEEHIRGNAA